MALLPRPASHHPRRAVLHTLTELFMFHTVMKLDADCTVPTWPQGLLP